MSVESRGRPPGTCASPTKVAARKETNTRIPIDNRTFLRPDSGRHKRAGRLVGEITVRLLTTPFLVYTLGAWRVKPGQEAEFITAWKALGHDLLRASTSTGHGHADPECVGPRMSSSRSARGSAWRTSKRCAAIRERSKRFSGLSVYAQKRRPARFVGSRRRLPDLRNPSKEG